MPDNSNLEQCAAKNRGGSRKGKRCEHRVTDKQENRWDGYLVCDTHRNEKFEPHHTAREEKRMENQLRLGLDMGPREMPTEEQIQGSRLARAMLAGADVPFPEVDMQYVNTGESKEDAMTDGKPLYVISFTGHRPNKLGGYSNNPIRFWVKTQMLDAVNRAIAVYGETHEIVIVWGGALGVDQWAAALANHLGLRHTCIIPFEGFRDRWPQESQDEFLALLDTTDAELSQSIADKLGVGETFEGGAIVVGQGFNMGLYQKRNIWMVNVADAVIAVWDRSAGGTANCVAYAVAQNKPRVFIDPRDYS